MIVVTVFWGLLAAVFRGLFQFSAAFMGAYMVLCELPWMSARAQLLTNVFVQLRSYIYIYFLFFIFYFCIVCCLLHTHSKINEKLNKQTNNNKTTV